MTENDKLYFKYVNKHLQIIVDIAEEFLNKVCILLFFV